MLNLPSSDPFTNRWCSTTEGSLERVLGARTAGTFSKAGGAKHVHQVRMMSEKNYDMVVVKVDMRNAHNEVSRASVLGALEREHSLRHLSWYVATRQASHTGLESGRKIWAGEDSRIEMILRVVESRLLLLQG